MTDIKLESREKELSKIYRYNSWLNIIFYRPNLLTHTSRVTWITKEICNKLEKLWLSFNKELAIELAKVHDDAEIITWDIVSTQKARWTIEEKKNYENNCKNAIEILYKNYKNSSNKFDYKYLLQLEEKENTKEFFIIKYADRLDAHWEVMHEIFWGNEEFVKREIQITKEFFEIHKNFFKVPYDKENLMIDSFCFTHWRIWKDLDNLCNSFNIKNENLKQFDIFNLEQIANIQEIFKNSKPHTLKSLKEPKNYNLYNFRINLHFKYWTQEQIKELYQVKSPDIAITSDTEIIQNDNNWIIHKHNWIIYRNKNKLTF